MDQTPEDLSASVPEGFGNVQQNASMRPMGPGVNFAELQESRAGAARERLRKRRGGESMGIKVVAWVLMIAVGLPLVIAGLIWWFGVIGLFAGIGLAIIVLLAVIAARLGGKRD